MQHKNISIFDIEGFSLGKKFRLLGKLYQSVLTKKLKHIGIEKYFSVLVLLDNIDAQCSQKLIADVLLTNKTTMVSILDDLVENGFIKRIKNPNDRREHWIQLTNKAKKYLPEIKKAINETNNLIIEGICLADANRIEEYLEIMYRNVLGEINNTL
jgi:DNA-binding MarR family transcriptional regulator